MGMPILLGMEYAFGALAVTASAQAGLDVTVYNGMDNATKVAPCIICTAGLGTEIYRDTGIYQIPFEITVKEMAPDTAVSGTISPVVWGIFKNPNIIANLNNQTPSVMIYDIFNVVDSKTESGDAWEQKITFTVIGVSTGN